MLHPKTEQARISGNILRSYNGTEKLTPVINQVEFEKSVKEDNITFYLDDVIKSWSGDMIKKLEEEKDEVKKSELNDQITNQISSLKKIDVVFDKVMKSVWVDVIDTESKTIKDNSLTRKLNLAGVAV